MGNDMRPIRKDGDMIFERTASGAPSLRSSTERRIAYAFLLSVVVGLLAFQAWNWLREAESLGPAIVATAGIVSLALFFMAGGASFVRNLVSEHYALDPRRREVLRNGKRLCGYDEVLELRIVVWTRSRTGHPDAHDFRLQLVLREGRGARWLGGNLGGFDQTDVMEVAQAFAEGIGTRVSVFR